MGRAHSRQGTARKRKMVDIADKIRKKLLDEIKTLEFEFHNELPKELMKARAHGDLSKRRI